MLSTIFSIFLQKDRGQSLQSQLLAFLSKGEDLDITQPSLIATLDSYESLLVAVERKRYKFPLRWSDRLVLAKYSRSAKNEMDGRSMRYNSSYIDLRNRCSKEQASVANIKS
jgi:hypothetical protein